MLFGKKRLAHTSGRVTAILNRNTHDISTDLMLRCIGLARGASETQIQERWLKFHAAVQSLRLHLRSVFNAPGLWLGVVSLFADRNLA